MNTNTRSRFKALVIFSLLFFVVLIQLSIHPVSAQESTQTDGECNGLDIVLLIDQSGSMYWNDPDGFRIEAARQVIHQLGDNALYLCPKTIHRIGVISFGNDSEIDLPFTKIDPDLDHLETWQTRRKQLKSEITSKNLEETDFSEAFAIAKQMFDGLGPLETMPRKRAIILLADGAPCVAELGCINGNYTFDDDLYLQALSVQIDRDFPFQSDAEGYYLWVVAMRNQSTDNDGSTDYLNRYLRTRDQTIREYWDELAQNRGGQLIRLSRNRNEIPTTFSQITTLLGDHASLKPLVCGIHYIEPYTEQVTIVFFKNDPNIAAKIEHILNDGSRAVLENGQSTQPNIVQIAEHSQEGPTERYVIHRPPPGAWNIFNDNCQAVAIHKDTIMPKVILVEPTTPLLLYDIDPFYDPNFPHYLVYQMKEKATGQPFPQDVQYPLSIQASITTPTGEIFTQMLSYAGEATYRTTEPLPVGELGTYQIRLIGETLSANPASAESYQVFSDEWGNYHVFSKIQVFDFEILEPAPDSVVPLDQLDSDDILPLEVKLRLIDEDGQPLDPARVFTGDSNSWFEVVLTDKDGASSNMTLTPDTTNLGILIGSFERATEEGSYQLEVIQNNQYEENRYLPRRVKDSISFTRLPAEFFEFFKIKIIEPQARQEQSLNEVKEGASRLLPFIVKVQFIDHSEVPLNWDEVFQNPSLKAVLYGPRRTRLESISLEPDPAADPSYFFGQFAGLNVEGEYRIEIELADMLTQERYYLLDPDKHLRVDFSRVAIEPFDYRILEPSQNITLPIHQPQGGCVAGYQQFPSIAIQVTNPSGRPKDKIELSHILTKSGSVPVAKLIAPDGTVEEIALEFVESPDGPQFVPKPQSMPVLAGEYRLEVLFEEGSINPRFAPLHSSRSVTFYRYDNLFTNPTVCRGMVGLTGTIIIGLLILMGGFFFSPPIGTLALVLAGTSDKLASPWKLRRYPRSQKIRSKQLEKLGIREIILSKVNPRNLDEAKIIKVKAKDMGGKWFITDKILHPSDDPQPFVDEIDIRYE